MVADVLDELAIFSVCATNATHSDRREKRPAFYVAPLLSKASM